MSWKYFALGAVSLLPLAAYAQDVTIPELPDFEMEIAPPAVPSLELEGEVATAPVMPDAPIVPDVSVPDVSEASPQEEPLAVDESDIPEFPEEQEVAQPTVGEEMPALGDPFAELEVPAIEAEGEVVQAVDMPELALDDAEHADGEAATELGIPAMDDLAAPDIPDIAFEDEVGDDLPDFEAELPTLPPLQEEVAEVSDGAAGEVPPLPIAPGGVPLLNLPPLPGQAAATDGNAPITFGNAVSADAPVAAKRDPNKKYAGKMPKNPAKTGIKRGYNFKRQYVPNEMYKTNYRRENRHLPALQTVQHYEREFFKAVAENRVADMRALRKHLGTVALRGEDGVTPLMVASHVGAHDAAVYLMQHGASRDAANFAGNTAMDYAAARGDSVMLGLLRGEYYVVAELK